MEKVNLTHKTKNKNIKRTIDKTEDIRTELDRRAFYLKTLYDISLEICGTVEIEAILKNFLLMTMGNFGVVQGFLFGLHLPTNEIYFISKGLHEGESDQLQRATKEFLLEEKAGHVSAFLSKQESVPLFEKIAKYLKKHLS